MLQDQSCHQVGQCRLYLRRQPRPCRHAAGRRLRFCCEQVDLLWRTAARSASFGVAWSSPRFWSRERIDTPESGAFDDVKRSFSTCRKQRRKLCERRQIDMGIAPHAPWRRPTGQTSRPEPPANGPHRNRSGCSEKQCHPTSRSPRERRPEDQTTDAMGTAVLETRFRGCSQALLYNEERPHGAIGQQTPIMLLNHDGAASPPS